MTRVLAGGVGFRWFGCGEVFGVGVDLGCYVFGFWIVVLCGFRVGFFAVW